MHNYCLYSNETHTDEPPDAEYLSDCEIRTFSLNLHLSLRPRQEVHMALSNKRGCGSRTHPRFLQCIAFDDVESGRLKDELDRFQVTESKGDVQGRLPLGRLKRANIETIHGTMRR